MDIWQLKIFVSVVENKSFSKASKQINLSQPTVSTHIKELEDHFQCRLLDRLGKKTEPTKAGLILYDHALQILSLKKKTESVMSDFLGNVKGGLTLGGSTIPAGYIIPKIIGPFSQAFPDVSLSLTAGDTSQVIKWIRQGKIELGIVGAKTRDPDILQQTLIRDEMMLVVPMDHEWAGRSSVSCRELVQQPLIAREKGSGTWQSFLKSMDEAGFGSQNLTTCITLGSSISIIQAIINKVGISILSKIAVSDYVEQEKLAVLTVDDLDLIRFFYITMATRRTQSPIGQKFIEFAKQHLGQPSAK